MPTPVPAQHSRVGALGERVVVGRRLHPVAVGAGQRLLRGRDPLHRERHRLARIPITVSWSFLPVWGSRVAEREQVEDAVLEDEPWSLKSVGLRRRLNCRAWERRLRRPRRTGLVGQAAQDLVGALVAAGHRREAVRRVAEERLVETAQAVVGEAFVVPDLPRLGGKEGLFRDDREPGWVEPRARRIAPSSRRPGSWAPPGRGRRTLRRTARVVHRVDERARDHGAHHS